MSLVLTGPQEQSLDLSSHLCVTANAGAGKTSVLARRFVEIVLRTDAKLSEIVAITFTEQAAGELRKKVHDVLLERERDGRRDPSERRRLADARNQLSSAIIGTIHSFCGRVLRMYPAEADVDASFTVVEGQDRARLIAESIAETFSDLMGRTDGAGPPDDFRELLRAVPPARLERFLLRLFTQREQMYRYFRRRGAGGAVELSAGPLLDRIAATVVDRAAESGWVDRAREVSESAAGKGAAAFREMLGDPGTDPGRGRLEELLMSAG
jgi:superfamily I DNA/RNA helicase